MSHRNEMRLGDLVTGKPQYGFTASASNSAVGPRFLRTTDLARARLDWSTVPYCPAGPEVVAKYGLARGDVVISRMGTVGVSAVIGDLAEDAVFASYLVRFRPDQRLVLPEYLGYVLRSTLWWEHVEAVSTGSVQPNLNAKLMADFRFEVPAIAEQAAAASVLRSLDDKIECNQRIAETADALWRMELAAAVRDSAETRPLSSLARFVNGKNFTKNATGAGRPVVRIAEMSKGITASTIRNDVPADPDNLCNSGDLLFAWSGSLQVMRWYAEEGLINQHIFKVVPEPGVPLWLLHGYLDILMPFYRGIAADKATTMGHIKREHLHEPVQVLSADKIQALDDACRPLWLRALAAERESLVLAELRDMLLPKLLSGEIRVEEAEEQVEEAV